MTLTRRNFLKLSGLAAATASATACSVAGNELAQRDLPQSLAAPTPPPAGAPGTRPTADVPALPEDPLLRLLNRGGYGPRPGDVAAAAALGLAATLELQLDPDSIDDRAADLYVRGLTTSGMDISQIIEMDVKDVAFDLHVGTTMRALLSKRQLYEAMVEFWTDHFNIYARKSPIMPALKLIDDREVIRPHALGRFRDLLWASAQSPAMLLYLDNARNVKGAPNENYARELMELHTLGVDGGYTQTDVMELARALTGMGVARRGRSRGKFQFNADEHDDGAKQLLGQTIPAGQGEVDLDRVLEILVTHPATAQFIATKLVRRFVADDPPADLVAQVAATFSASDGDIKEMLRVIFLSEAFATAPAKLKRPYTLLISALRALNVELTRGRREIALWLERMGQPLYLWPPPNGYPDVSAAWAGNLLPRWNFCLALATNGIRGAQVPLERIAAAGGVDGISSAVTLFAGLIFGRGLPDEQLAVYRDHIGSGALDRPEIRRAAQEAVGLMLCSPQFQWT